MDYITEKLKERIRLAKASSNVKDLIQYSNTLIQYYLFETFAILYNSDINISERSLNKQKLLRPSLGTMLELSRNLNNQHGIFKKWKELEIVFSKFIELRNNSGQGHGFDFTHDNQSQVDEYNSIISQIEKNDSLLRQKYNMVCVQVFDGLNYKGINYSSNGRIVPWSIPKSGSFNFEIGDVYLQGTSGFLESLFDNVISYHKISPFLKIDHDDFWLFQSIREPLTGAIKYNNIFKTSQSVFEYLPFKNFGLIATEEFSERQISLNGTIRNNYDINFKEFISIYDKDSFAEEVYDFLKSKSSAVATIWGHGGVGKTATLQFISEKIFLNERKDLEKKNLYFNYIIFLSAKDRRYDYISGKIDTIEGEKLTDFSGFILKLNEVIFNTSSTDENKIIDDFIDRALIIIDDFETFNYEEREKILAFLDKLDVNRHKVIISSRLTTTTGREIEKGELNEDDTIKFLKAILVNHFKHDISQFDFTETQTIYNIYKITSGRPLFIFHFAYLLLQNQNIEEITNLDIKNTKAAIEFLYGRLYSYLDSEAKILYKALGYVVSKSDLLCPVGNIQYLIGMDNSKFQKCILLLEKLRIITLSESRDTLSIYSSEILLDMEDRLKKDQPLQSQLNNKMKSESYITLGSSKSIFNQKLEGVRIKAKIERNTSIVVDDYEILIKDTTFSHEERLTAFEELINYLTHKNIDYSFALEICNEYSLYFKNESKFCLKYFETLRDSSRKAEAILLANTFIEANLDINRSNLDYFTLAGRYLQLLAKSLTSAKDELNDQKQEIEGDDFSKMNYSLRNDMISTIEKSKKIFINLVKISYGNLSIKQKRAISEGFLAVVKMMRRVLNDKTEVNPERLEVFTEICDYGISHFIPDCQTQLINIKFQVFSNELKEQNEKNKNNYSSNNGNSKDDKLSDFGEKLKQALKGN